MADLPVLLGESSGGKTKQWLIRVVDRAPVADIVTRHGYVDGKQIESTRTISAGKNIGRKNATTPLEQARKEATAVWKKKLESGYRREAVDEAAPAPAAPPLPMLAHDYTKRGHDIVFPAYCQRKLDGVRCIAGPTGLYTRTGKRILKFANIQAFIDRLNLEAGVYLDGELYSDSLSFQEIVSEVRSSRPQYMEAQIYLCVYDVIMPGTMEERLAFLRKLLPTAVKVKALPEEIIYTPHAVTNVVRLLPTEECGDAASMKELHTKYVGEGFEGLIVRNKAGPYTTKYRSADLQKFKTFLDGEFMVVGYTQGTGTDDGTVIWVCETEAHKKFNVRPKGTHVHRMELYQQADDFVGLKLTVRYQEMTDGGVPRFPVGIAFRDYE